MPPGIVILRWATLLVAALSAACGPAMAGAASSDPGPASDSRAHWAFRAAPPVSPPAVRQSSWIRNSIDPFILTPLEAIGLKPAPAASREQLIRRVKFDLLGLPPTPDEIDAFVADRSPDAWPRLIDRLLDSPHYGERWARHWLDVVRYAESDGFEHDAVRPNSWRYRDYVVRSLNEDKPYDRFVQEQVAGDELWPDDPDAVIATAFQLLGPDMVDSADQTQRRLLTLSDMTDTTATAFLALTLGCARCHDHKLEPLSQADYYSFQAYFTAAEFQRDRPVPTATERRRHELEMVGYNEKAGLIRSQLSELESPARERVREQKLAGMSEDVQLAHRTPQERRTPEQESSVLETTPHLHVTDSELVRALASPDRSRRAQLVAELKKIPAPAPLPATLALHNTNGPVPATHVLLRGDYNNPAQVVTPNPPQVLLRHGPSDTPAAVAAEQAGVSAATVRAHLKDVHPGQREQKSTAQLPRRAALARWLTQPGHPLTARVMVNRVWQHHFGRGLVATPNDFGTQGARPSHPQLLDWLAHEFVSHGWSLKALHRLILLSSTYQQSSVATASQLRLDPDNRWFSRQNRVRLEGEALRDSLYFISGQLDLRVGGPSVQPPIAADVVRTSKNWTASEDPTDHRRRSLYIFARRNFRYPFLEVFDAPDSNLSCAARGQSTTAPQSLTLLNSAEVLFATRETARRVTRAARSDDGRIEQAFRLILGRTCTRAERRAAREFVTATRARAFQNSLPSAEFLEWTELCRALFNLNDFVYVD